MTRLVIELPDDVTERLSSRAAEAGHDTPEAFVRSLVMDATAVDLGGPARLKVASIDDIERLVSDRIDDAEGSFEPDAAFLRGLKEYAARRPRSGGAE